MREDDLSYSQRRAEEEATQSLMIGDPSVATIHRQLAAAYRQRVKQLIATHPPEPIPSA